MPHEKKYTRKMGKRDTDEKEKRQRGHNHIGAQPHRRHYGLYNQGATCYLNSVLQLLAMTTEIHDRLDHDSQTDQQLKQIFELLKRETCTTRTITAAFGITNVYEQRDAPECLEMILNKISRRASEVFQGELTHRTECSKGHSINEETNPFWTLPLSLQDTHDTTYSVERSFERIFHLKSFSGDNMVYCNECEEKTEATSGCEMVKYPQILTLLLKRFDFDYRTMSYFKSHRCVIVPRTLQRKDKEYKLYGMVHHNGSLTGGHYTATILCSEDKTWYEFNDAHVSKVRQQPFAEASTYKSETAYLLMYRANSESLRDDAQPNQDETRKLNDLKPDHGEIKISGGERDTDNGKKRKTEQNEGDDVQMKRHEASGHQAGGEKDAAPAAQKRGPLEMSNDLTVKAKKSKLTDDAAEQDKTATECQSLSEDTLKEQQDGDTLKEQQGGDTLKEQQGEDSLKEQQGGDTLKEQQGEDSLKEQQGGDTLQEQQGGDTLKEQQGEDTLKEQQGGDTLQEQQGGDTLKEQQGGDTLKEQQGGDTLKEQQGGDTLQEQQMITDAAPMRGQSGSKKKSSWKRLKGKKSKVPDDAAEQDKTDAAQKRGQSGSKQKSSWKCFSCINSSGTYDAAEQYKKVV